MVVFKLIQEEKYKITKYLLKFYGRLEAIDNLLLGD
jgi:hypothetical protein